MKIQYFVYKGKLFGINQTELIHPQSSSSNNFGKYLRFIPIDLDKLKELK